ncbi:cubilin-like isoform X2 [Scylla paramamosain]
MVIEKALGIKGRSSQEEDVATVCDELVTNEEFYLHSPGYPENYPPNMTCRYEILRRHPNVCGVVFTVLRLDLAAPSDFPFNQTHHRDDKDRHGVCPGDSLVINNVVYCGRYQRGKTATFAFTSSLMTVEFRSGAGHGASGFLLQGRQVSTCRQPRSLGPPLISSIPCNRRVEGASFVVMSPGYPEQYSHNLECRYTIVRSGPHVCGLQLVVQGFIVEDGSCMFDYLEVQGQRLCGTLPPGFTRHFNFEGDEVVIRFRSDESTKRPGFVIRGQQTPCMESPPVQASLSQSPPGRVENQQKSTSSQTTTQSQSTSSPSLSINTTTANQTDAHINYILSILDRQPHQTGREDGIEGRNISDEDFTEVDLGLVTFREPDDDHTNADQNIPGSPDFNPFTTEGLTPTVPTTSTDLFSIPTDFPTNPTDFSTIPTEFSTIPTDFSTGLTDFPTTVNFPSTSSFPTLTSDCDRLITAVTTDIESPNYPNNYPVSKQCAYVVGRASENVCRLEVNFLSVDLPSQDPVTNECIGDYVNVDGTKFCGTFQNRIVTINFPDQTVTLSFFSDASVTGRGFKLRVTQLSNGCGGPVQPPIPPGQCDATSQQPAFLLLSPGYPVRYPPSTECITTVLRSSPDVNSLVLELVDFELGTTLGCSGDYLEVGGERLCGLLTGQTRTVPFVGNSVTIKFHSEANLGVGGRGYRIRVSQSSTSIIPNGCGSLVTTPTASLQSPNYPNSYPPNIDCRYVINKVSHDICQLQLKILDMDIENGVGCGRDYLQVAVQERLCGRRIPGEIRKYHFTNRQMSLLFHSDVFGSGRGFRIEIRQVSCGHFKPMYPYYPTHRPHHHHNYGHHHHHHNHGTKKPIYTHHHRPWWNHNPHWRPRYPSHQHSSSYTQQTTLCPYFPSVTSQWPHTTPRPTFPPPTTITTLPTIIPSSTIPTIPTVTPVRFIPQPIPAIDASSFRSDINSTNEESDRDAKRVPISSNDSLCQQVVDSDHFILQSPGYPAPYYTNARCFYSIVRGSDMACGVELTVDEFDIERSPNCGEAYLELAGRRYCGSLDHDVQSVIPFNATQPIVLKFVAGQYSSSNGFSLRGRRISCSKTKGTDSRTAEVVEQGQHRPQSSGEGSHKNKGVTLSRTDEAGEAEWLNRFVEDGDMVLLWVGPGGPVSSPLVDKRRLVQVPS